MPDDVMVAGPSPRATLCALAVAGALGGGLGGALVGVRLADGDGLQDAMAHDAPAAVSGSRAAQVAAQAARSVLRQPTPWSAAAVMQSAAKRAPRHHAAVVRRAAVQAPATAPVSSPVTVSPTATTPARQDNTIQTGRANTPQVTATPTPEPRQAPAEPRPQPKPKPAPKPDAQQPTGGFDDSG